MKIHKRLQKSSDPNTGNMLRAALSANTLLIGALYMHIFIFNLCQVLSSASTVQILLHFHCAFIIADLSDFQYYCVYFFTIMSGRWPASSSAASASKVPRKSLALDVNLQVLRRLEARESQVNVGVAFRLATWKVRTIIKNANKIKASSMMNMVDGNKGNPFKEQFV